MSPETLPQVSLGTAVLLVFIFSVGFVMLRGVARMIVGTIILGLSVWVAYIAWQNAPTLSFEWFGKTYPAVSYGLPAIALVITFLLLRMLVTAAMSPFGPSPEPSPPGSLVSFAFRLLLALVPTALILGICVTIIHHAGSVAEIRSYAEKSLGIPESRSKAFVQQLKNTVAAVVPEAWLRFLDPLAEPERLQLAKMIATQSQRDLPPVMDTATGKPYPRAIVVDDPQLQNLAHEGKFGTLLRHPRLTKALEDPKLRKFLGIND